MPFFKTIYEAFYDKNKRIRTFFDLKKGVETFFRYLFTKVRKDSARIIQSNISNIYLIDNLFFLYLLAKAKFSTVERF